MLDYKGSTALVTGASGGLGEAFAEQLAQRGCNLVLVARSEDKLKMIAQRLEQLHNIKTALTAADLGSPAAVAHVIAEVKRRSIDIDLLVNNAGFGIFERFVETPLPRQMQQVDVNIRALLTLTHAFAQGMVARGKGGVINLASSAGFQPLAGANIYAALKSFVILFSEALAQELAKRTVHVLAVCPGPVATAFYADMNPANRQEPDGRPHIDRAGSAPGLRQGQAGPHPRKALDPRERLCRAVVSSQTYCPDRGGHGAQARSSNS
jgi:uncharacterized protein